MTYRVSPDVAWREVAGELFAITPDGKLHNVRSQAGMRAFELLRDGLDTEAVVSTLAAEFDVDEAALRKDLDEFFATLLDKGIIIAA